jgi:hypothetical protein
LASSPSRQQELLERVRESGILYAHQLPDADRRDKHESASVASALLNGRSKELFPFHSQEIDLQDAELDCEQREAVARALQTPDICLIAGAPGSGKSRVVVEILSQAASRGERVLFLAPGTAAIDCVVGRLLRRGMEFLVRIAGADETTGSLAPQMQKVLLDSRVRHFSDETLPQARNAATTARDQADRVRRILALRAQATEIAVRRAQAGARRRAIDERYAALVEAVRTAAQAEPVLGSDFGDSLAAARRSRDDRLANLDARESSNHAELEKARAAEAALEAEIAGLSALIRSRLRFWNPAWWQARRRGNPEVRLEELKTRQHALCAEAASRAADAAAIATERAAIDAEFRSTVAGAVQGEVSRRAGDLKSEQAEADAELSRLTCESEAFASGIDPSIRADVVEVNHSLEPAEHDARRLRAAEQAVIAAESWVAAVEKAVPGIRSQLVASAEVVAATTSAFVAEPLFAQAPARFDLLVFEEADKITEAEFQRASRLARRWVLVGELAGEPDARGPQKSIRSTTLRPGYFQKIWENLHAQPTRLPASWQRAADGRLRCQFRPLTIEEQNLVESECVADRPDIELQILTPPRGTPELVAVVFPAEMSAGQAKTYLFEELDALPIQTRGHNLLWRVENDRVVLQFDAEDAAPVESVNLAPGATELLKTADGGRAEASPPCLTRALSFDRAAGWTREKAEDWIARHAGVRDSGRTIYLSVAHRMRPALARFVSGLLESKNGFHHRGSVAESGDETVVEFVPVPALQVDSDARKTVEGEAQRTNATTATAPRIRNLKNGAGLETDLSEARRPDVLPSELRDALPDRGLVNYVEAVAVINDLSALAADPKFREEALHWQQSASHRGDHGPAIAVIALYSSQAELIRRLVERTGLKSLPPVTIEIGTPEQFQHRECLIALVSLTRSHKHRAVSFGDGPESVALACTRARSRLHLYGDPGTLTRRSLCAESVDNRDSAAAARERELVSRLVSCIHGQGDRSHFRLRQGTGT